MGDAPVFSLYDQSGRPFGNADLYGYDWLANFISTSCHDPCRTVLTPKMQELQREIEADPDLAQRVQILSISVDPARDNPYVLAQYARSVGADPTLWRFLTSIEEKTITDLLQIGFKVGAEEQVVTEGDRTLTHSTRFVLVDAAGTIRALYDGEAAPASQMLADLRRLARETSTVVAQPTLCVLPGSEPQRASGALLSAGSHHTEGSRVLVSDEKAGGYTFRVWAAPSPPQVGLYSVYVRLADARTGEGVREAQVTIQATVLDTGDARTAVADHRNAGSALDYASHFVLAQPGPHEFRVQVSGPAGQAQVTFLEQVARKSTNLAYIIAGVAPFIALLGAVAWFRRARRVG
ncbi:MAG: SCO family protein [Anaerolineae bacterium]|nr:SCO family protein [Anaerolineae bacterium]